MSLKWSLTYACLASAKGPWCKHQDTWCISMNYKDNSWLKCNSFNYTVTQWSNYSNRIVTKAITYYQSSMNVQKQKQCHLLWRQKPTKKCLLTQHKPIALSNILENNILSNDPFEGLSIANHWDQEPKLSRDSFWLFIHMFTTRNILWETSGWIGLGLI